MLKNIVIIGFGGHSKSVIDTINRINKYKPVGYTDKQNNGIYQNINYLGDDGCLSAVYENGTSLAHVAIGFLGNDYTRDKLYTYVKGIGFGLPALIDPSAIVSDDSEIGEGVYVGKNVTINAGSQIGRMCIINTGAIIEHENVIRDYSHISVGSILCGGVEVGNHCFIGANATVVQGITIGDKVIIGAGSLVLRNVETGEKVMGIVK